MIRIYIKNAIRNYCRIRKGNRSFSQKAYRINVTWWMMAITGALAIFIALITISIQAIKAAVANPVESLRIESCGDVQLAIVKM
jgi:hypothetical protein